MQNPSAPTAFHFTHTYVSYQYKAAKKTTTTFYTFIGENTRLIYDVINHLIEKKGSGLIMSADFEAAFDSLSWEFVSKVLHQYGFGPNFREVISLFYLNPQNFSRIMLNGRN